MWTYRNAWFLIIAIESPYFVCRERNCGFTGSLTTLKRVLHDLGFEYELRDGTRVLREGPFIVAKRIQFLKKLKRLIDAGKLIIYQDETWTNRRGTGKTKEWQDNDIRSSSMKTASTGDRYIVCHAGGKDGFVPNASLFLRTVAKPKQSDDYHNDMNGELFEKWFKEQLLPNLKEPCAIVMDNASYHSVRVSIFIHYCGIDTMAFYKMLTF